MGSSRMGIREFRAGLTAVIAAGEFVTVMRRGRAVGVFVPTAPSQPIAPEIATPATDLTAFKSASAKLDRLLVLRDTDVEEIAAEFDAARRTSRKRGLTA